MEYPYNIYKTFEVVEKEIMGEKHYGLLRVYSIFGFKLKRHIKICRYAGSYGFNGGALMHVDGGILNILLKV